MPDLTPVFVAMGVALGATGAISLLLAMALRRAGAARWPFVGSWSVGLGFLVGSWALTRRLPISLAEDQDRLLGVLLPLAMLAETLAALMPPKRAWPWIGRGAIALLALPILLWDTVYLADKAGPGSRLWSLSEISGYCATASILLLLPWWLSANQARRPGNGMLENLFLALGMAFVCAMTGLAVMATGYLTGGQLGAVLAAALVGLAAALGKSDVIGGAVGVTLVGWFGVLIMGRFSASLPAGPALVLWLAALTLTIPLRWPRPWAGACLRFFLALGLSLGAVAWALRSPDAEATDGSDKTEPSLQDYLDVR